MGGQVAAPYEGDVLATPEIAHIVGMTTLGKMHKDLGATSFRVLDRDGHVVASGAFDKAEGQTERCNLL